MRIMGLLGLVFLVKIALGRAAVVRNDTEGCVAKKIVQKRTLRYYFQLQAVLFESIPNQEAQDIQKDFLYRVTVLE